MTKLATIGAVIWGLLVVVWDTVWKFYSGEINQQRKDAEEENEDITRANQNANGVYGMSRADKLRFLENRGRLRNPPGDGGSH